MTAYLRIKPAFSGQKILPDEIFKFIKQSGIVYGICEDSIRSFCEEKRFYSELMCAKGVLPVDGTDGWINYNFNTDKGLMPKERNDGTVDFRDLGLVKIFPKVMSCALSPHLYWARTVLTFMNT